MPYALGRKLEFCKTFYLKKDAKQKQKVALEAAAKLDPGGDSSWFVKVLADAKQIESMAQVRKLHFLLPSNRPGEALTAPF